jgi:hypothetical protein
MFLLQTLVFSAFGVLLRNICLLTKRSLFSSALSGQRNIGNTESLMHFKKHQCKEFVGFFNYLKNIGPGSGISGSAGDCRYPSIMLALWTLANFSKFTMDISPPYPVYMEEVLRLACLFYFAIILTDSLESPKESENDVEELEKSLLQNEDVWSSSIQALIFVLIQGRCLGLENPRRTKHLIELMDTSSLLSLSSWTRVKETLLDTLCGIPVERSPSISWNENLLLA